jgi:hypothetical protein
VSPPLYSKSEAILSQTTPVRTAQIKPAALKGERRASVRFDANAKGTCQTLSVRHESAWEATVRNISCQGIGILLGRRFEPGAVLTIELTTSTEERQRLLLARVAHATFQADENKWLIGCTLLSPLSEDEIQELL